MHMKHVHTYTLSINVCTHVCTYAKYCTVIASECIHGLVDVHACSVYTAGS